MYQNYRLGPIYFGHHKLLKFLRYGFMEKPANFRFLNYINSAISGVINGASIYWTLKDVIYSLPEP